MFFIYLDQYDNTKYIVINGLITIIKHGNLGKTMLSILQI